MDIYIKKVNTFMAVSISTISSDQINFTFFQNNTKKRQANRTQNADFLLKPNLIFEFKRNLSRDFKERFSQPSKETVGLSH